MRSPCFLLLVVVAGCTGEGLEIPLGGSQPDMRADFSVPKLGFDIGVEPGSTCSDIIDCTNDCMTQSCVTKCVNKGSAAAKAAYNAFVECIDSACPAVPGGDAGTNQPCAYNPATGELLNQQACDNCVEQAQGFEGKCENAVAVCLGQM
jgi:hypothetical protein